LDGDNGKYVSEKVDLKEIDLYELNFQAKIIGEDITYQAYLVDADEEEKVLSNVLEETVEKNYHTYEFEITGLEDEYVVIDGGLTNPVDSDFDNMTPVGMSIAIDTKNNTAYDGMVRVAQVNAENLQLWAYSEDDENWYDINQVGWGPAGGFPIDTTAVTEVYVVPTAAFEKEITMELVDVTEDYGATGDIIISQSISITAVIQGSLEPTGNVGIAPDTAEEDAAGKIFAEYKLVADSTDISLADNNVEYIKVKVGDGEWEELTPNTDATLWFNVEAETGERTFKVKTKDGKIYNATLDWQEEIKIATWEATGEEGEHEEITYVEYKLMYDSNQVSLAEGEVKLIAIKDDGKWLALDPNIDTTLWFNKDHATGDYEFFVVTDEDEMYEATLEWTKPSSSS